MNLRRCGFAGAGWHCDCAAVSGQKAELYTAWGESRILYREIRRRKIAERAEMLESTA